MTIFTFLQFDHVHTFAFSQFSHFWVLTFFILTVFRFLRLDHFYIFVFDFVDFLDFVNIFEVWEICFRYVSPSVRMWQSSHPEMLAHLKKLRVRCRKETYFSQHQCLVLFILHCTLYYIVNKLSTQLKFTLHTVLYCMHTMSTQHTNVIVIANYTVQT